MFERPVTGVAGAGWVLTEAGGESSQPCKEQAEDEGGGMQALGTVRAKHVGRGSVSLGHTGPCGQPRGKVDT